MCGCLFTTCKNKMVEGRKRERERDKKKRGREAERREREKIEKIMHSFNLVFPKLFCSEDALTRSKSYLKPLKAKRLNLYPRQDSSISSISTWYWGGPGFKPRQG